MKIYQVGGSVRDELLGLEPKDKDYVVVGSSVEEMTALGYSLVGKDFPVFHHPVTKDEYALARLERKTGSGYLGFTCEINNVSIEEDLYRRDLTINAMAKDEEGNLVDPYGGQDDLKNKVLRHVSAHFSEDPMRALRVARFQARYSDFSVSLETKELMKVLVEKEMKFLSPERFKKEFEKAMLEKEAYLFFELLEEVGFFNHFLNNFYFKKEFKVINKEASVVAKTIYLILLQENKEKALKEFQDKLGFKDSIFKEVLNFFLRINKKEYSLKDVVDVMLQTRAHQRLDLVNYAKELFTLLNQEYQFLKEVEKAVVLYKETDFSFVEQIDVKDRKNAVKEKLISLLK